MKMIGWMMRVCGCLAMAVIGMSASADVFTDCTAWYIGGKGSVGAFANGDMTDIRHAAIADSPTHGGAMCANAVGISNLCENVYSAASGRTFANQRTIYLAQRKTASGTYKIYENGVSLPFTATNENYTLLLRLRLDDAQPTNKTWVHVADLGYNGGTPKYSFAVRYYPQTESLGLLYNGGNGKPIYVSPTNDVCTTLRGKWLELSVSLSMLSSGSSRMRVGVGAEGITRTYWHTDYKFPAGQSVPYEKTIYLAGVTRYGNSTTTCSPARGSYHMISYWERVLTDDEILEAFKWQGPDGSAATSPALLKIGDAAWSGDVMDGTISGSRATPSTDLQDLGGFPAQMMAGQSLDIPFTVPETCTNLRQVVRLTGAAGSSAATVQIAVDDQVVVPALSVQAAKTADAGLSAQLFTAGSHKLTLSCTEAGGGTFRFAALALSGSFRLGWIDNSQNELGGDLGYVTGTKTFTLVDLTTNAWTTYRSSVTSTRFADVVFDLDAEDAALRTAVLRAKPCNLPAQSFDYVILLNGTEIFRRIISPESPYAAARFAPIEVGFPPKTLLAGRNVITFKSEINEALDPSPTGTWIQNDYVELEVGEPPRGTVMLLR